MTEQEVIDLNNEFSNEFDVLYNSITSNQAPGLDEYEKSVFLTKAQDEVVKAYFNPRSNKIQQGFDGNEIRQIDFSMIMRSQVYKEFLSSNFDRRKNSKLVSIEKDILVITNEYVIVTRDDIPYRLSIVPITYNEYAQLTSKPYAYPLKNQAWRLLGSDDENKSAEIIVGPNDIITEYVIRYVKKPRAIRLKSFDDITIDGASTIQCCELDPILYPDIIQRGCELAKATYLGDLSSQIALGQTSHTELGNITRSE